MGHRRLTKNSKQYDYEHNEMDYSKEPKFTGGEIFDGCLPNKIRHRRAARHEV